MAPFKFRNRAGNRDAPNDPTMELDYVIFRTPPTPELTVAAPLRSDVAAERVFIVGCVKLVAWRRQIRQMS